MHSRPSGPPQSSGQATDGSAFHGGDHHTPPTVCLNQPGISESPPSERSKDTSNGNLDDLITMSNVKWYEQGANVKIWEGEKGLQLKADPCGEPTCATLIGKPDPEGGINPYTAVLSVPATSKGSFNRTYWPSQGEAAYGEFLPMKGDVAFPGTEWPDVKIGEVVKGFVPNYVAYGKLDDDSEEREESSY